MTESINLEPNWEGMRAWVLNVYKTDPATARKIAADMGSEAPELPEDEGPVEEPYSGQLIIDADYMPEQDTWEFMVRFGYEDAEASWTDLTMDQVRGDYDELRMRLGVVLIECFLSDYEESRQRRTM